MMAPSEKKKNCATVNIHKIGLLYRSCPNQKREIQLNKNNVCSSKRPLLNIAKAKSTIKQSLSPLYSSSETNKKITK